MDKHIWHQHTCSLKSFSNYNFKAEVNLIFDKIIIPIENQNSGWWKSVWSSTLFFSMGRNARSRGHKSTTGHKSNKRKLYFSRDLDLVHQDVEKSMHLLKYLLSVFCIFSFYR